MKEKVKVCVHLCLHRCAGVTWIVVGFGTKVDTFLFKVHCFFRIFVWYFPSASSEER